MVKTELLKLDIDLGLSSIPRETRLIRIIEAKSYAWATLHTRSVKIWETTKGYHIEALIFFPWDIETLPLWQLLLGSDFWREVKNVQRIKHKVKNWNVLFEEKNGKQFKRQRKLEKAFMEAVIWCAQHRQG
jgi:hypothetical protein